MKNMGKVILGVTISLDGFAEDSNGSVGAVYPDLDILRNTGVLRESIDTTGSVVMAWKEFAMAKDPDSLADNYEWWNFQPAGHILDFVLLNRIFRQREKWIRSFGNNRKSPDWRLEHLWLLL